MDNRDRLPLERLQLPSGGKTTASRHRMAHQLQPCRVEDRPKKGRQLGLVTPRCNQYARTRTLGIPALPRRPMIPQNTSANPTVPTPEYRMTDMNSFGMNRRNKAARWSG